MKLDKIQNNIEKLFIIFAYSLSGIFIIAILFKVLIQYLFDF